jgi:hypothetical protein
MLGPDRHQARFAIANMVAGGFGAWTANARAFRIEPAP